MMQLFTVAVTKTPGQIIGNFLLGLGHRRAAYITMFVNEPWSFNRWQGLRDTFLIAGLKEGVTLHGVDSMSPWREVFDAKPGSPIFDSAVPKMAEIQKTVNPQSLRNPRDFYVASFYYLWELKVEEILAPIFQKALQDRSITAWVAESDFVALQAMAFLRGHGMRVPEDISVVGIDDTVEALGERLTTYSFNAAGLVHATLNHILKAGTTRRLHNKGPMEIPGMLKERRTTGPVKSRAV
jgi:DNA-binding LacI/PurR family transcriptional regulator